MATETTAQSTSWSKYTPFTGAIFVVLWLVGALLIAQYEFMPSAEDAVSSLEDGSRRIQIGGYLIGLSAFFLIWFCGSLRDYLAGLGDGNERLANIAFGGGLVAAGLVLVSSIIYWVAAARAGSDGGIGPEYASIALDFAGAFVGNAFAFAIGAVIYAKSIVWFRTGAVPKWLAWLAGVFGIALLTPVNWAIVAVVIPAFLLLSVLVYRRQESAGQAG